MVFLLPRISNVVISFLLFSRFWMFSSIICGLVYSLSWNILIQWRGMYPFVALVHVPLHSICLWKKTATFVCFRFFVSVSVFDSLFDSLFDVDGYFTLIRNTTNSHCMNQCLSWLVQLFWCNIIDIPGCSHKFWFPVILDILWSYWFHKQVNYLFIKGIGFDEVLMFFNLLQLTFNISMINV